MASPAAISEADKSPDQQPEEYVIRSGVRPGLKREFAFAMKAQAELSPNLGRGRPRGGPRPSYAEDSPPLPPLRLTKKTPPAQRSGGESGPSRKRGRPRKNPPPAPAPAAGNVTAVDPHGLGAPQVDNFFPVDIFTGSWSGFTGKIKIDSQSRYRAEGSSSMRPESGSPDGGAGGREGHQQNIEVGLLPSEFTSSLDTYQRLNQSLMASSSGQGDHSDAGLSGPVASASHNDRLSDVSRRNPGNLTTIRDLGFHKFVFKYLKERTEVAYYSQGQKLLGGRIEQERILCSHCSKLVSPSDFEAHAGAGWRRKPYHNICIPGGVSLHKISVYLLENRKLFDSKSDGLCGKCKSSAGQLVECKFCPRAFHQECLGASSISRPWACKLCRDMRRKEKLTEQDIDAIVAGSVLRVDPTRQIYDGQVRILKPSEHNTDAFAAGSVPGADPREQIYDGQIRIMKTSETNAGGCVLCREHDFSGGFDPRTVLLCDQCEKEYHVGCLKDQNICDLKELPEDEWFCSVDCKKLYSDLQALVYNGAEPQVNGQILRGDTAVDFCWRLLKSKATYASELLLSGAISIFNEAFGKIAESPNSPDLIPHMVKGSEDFMGHDFRGMYCAVLMVDSSLVSAAILRVLGRDVAEIPLVATSREYQGRGYFKALFHCLERLLESLEVKSLVLPAAEGTESMWAEKFGFTKISPSLLRLYTGGAPIMVFEGASMLYKAVSSSLAL